MGWERVFFYKGIKHTELLMVVAFGRKGNGIGNGG